ncbi:MAG: alpha/beta hydrolase family protein [Halobacteriaceae archaeon]
MDPDVTTFKHNEMYVELWSADELVPDREYEFVISCMGMPSHPHQHNPATFDSLLEEGYVVAYPHYKGSWGSSGEFSWEGCVETVNTVVSFLENGSGTDAFGGEHAWQCSSIKLVGGSFGGSVVLLAGAQSDVDKIVAVAPVVDWEVHFQATEEGKELLRGAIERAWDELWRIPDEEWQRLETADFQPFEYLEDLHQTEVLIIHGEHDEVVPPESTEKFAREIGAERLLIDDEHRGSGVVGEDGVADRVLQFLG